MVFTVAGILTERREVQPLNAEEAMEVIPSGSSMLPRAVQ